MANVLTNLFNVATGSGAHEEAMREYLNPFKGGQTYNIDQGPVADYMSSYLKDYVRPDNPLSQGKWKDGIMSITGLGQSPNPFTKKGLTIAANLSSDPSFQAENLFGEGTLRKTDSGYDYTGGKFDFNFEPSSALGWFEKNILRPSEYKMYFDKDFRPQKKLIHAKQRKQITQQQEAAKKKTITTGGPPSITQTGGGDVSNINIQKRKIGMPEHLTRIPPKKTYVAPLGPRGDGGGGQRGSMPTGTAGRNPWGRADGGLINFYRYGGFIG